MIELWKDIPEYEGLYQISNLGNIKNINYRNTKKERKMKCHINKNGYVYAVLRKNKMSKTYLVHRLVAKVFIPNPENKICVNHIDCNRHNNNINNLEWYTHKENINYMDLLDRRIANKHLSNEEVKEIRNKRKKGLFYKDVWKEYKNKISLKGFEKIWYNMNWKNVKEDK